MRNLSAKIMRLFFYEAPAEIMGISTLHTCSFFAIMVGHLKVNTIFFMLQTIKVDDKHWKRRKTKFGRIALYHHMAVKNSLKQIIRYIQNRVKKQHTAKAA